MTDEQIIKALECCCVRECDECPYDEQTACIGIMKEGALALINRQKAEIEMLKHDRKKLKREFLTVRYETKNETIKDFSERFEDEMGEDFFEHYPFVLTALDNVAEEMTNQLTRIEHDSLCETKTYKG